jgi:hypothetical protein
MESWRRWGVATVGSCSVGAHAQRLGAAADRIAGADRESVARPGVLSTHRGSAAGQAGSGAGACVVAARASQLSPDRHRLLQYGIHVERSAAHLRRWARQRGGRSAQGRKRSGGSGHRRGSAMGARLFSPGDRPRRGPTGGISLQQSRRPADHAVAPGEWRMAAAAAQCVGSPSVVAGMAGPGRPSVALPARQQRCGELSARPGNHERALWRRPAVATPAGGGARYRRLALARNARHRTGGLSPQ